MTLSGQRSSPILTSSQINEGEFQIDYRPYLVDSKVAGTVLTKPVAIGVIDSRCEMLRERKQTGIPIQIQAWLKFSP
jgi:hypothetical protein